VATSALRKSQEDEYGISTPLILSKERDYRANIKNESHNASVGAAEAKGIHNRLYQEKDKYFERKRFVNT
jgi:hypothetical protein